MIIIIGLILLGVYYIFWGRYEITVYNKLRSFKSKVNPSSEAEKVILDSFKVEITNEFQELKNIFIDGENLVEVYKGRVASKTNPRKIRVNSLRELNENEYTDIDKMDKYYSQLEKLKEYNPNQYNVYEVNYNIIYYAEYSMMAQWGSGRWTRYYVVTREKEDSDWRVFDIYWQM